MWGLGSAGTPAAETESPGRSLGRPEPDGEKAEGSFLEMLVLTSRGSPVPPAGFPQPFWPGLHVYHMGLLEQLQEK